MTDSQLKRLLEERLDVGELLVQRSGSCSSFTWTITWVDKGGNHPQLMVNSSLIGNQASITSNPIDDGRFFLRPIPGEFLRTPNTVPQVRLTQSFLLNFTFFYLRFGLLYNTSLIYNKWLLST